MSFLSNPLSTPLQLSTAYTINAPLSRDTVDRIRFSTSRLTQAAGILLDLPQEIIAQAIVLLCRYWTVDSLLEQEYSDVSAAVVYLTAKVSAQPRSLRSIANVYTYLLSPASSLVDPSISEAKTPPNPEAFYLSQSVYQTFTERILLIEGYVCNALGFQLHVALPHPLAITYLLTLDLFSENYKKSEGSRLAKRGIAHLNTALLSPQLLYLTHQPNALAVAAVYLAAREEGINLASCEWWEVFDVDREELGFLVVAYLSIEGWCKEQGSRMKGVLRKEDIQRELLGVTDEEAELARMMDERTSG